MTPTTLGVGAWLKNTACLLLRGQPRWSALHGDLGDPAACAALDATVDALVQRAAATGAPVQAVAHDHHPDFYSTRVAEASAAALGVPAVPVQHHHAHVAAVLAHHGWREPVVGLALDGVGLGSDGTAWGGELLWVDGVRWARVGHLRTLPLPGGDRAAREPWRVAAAVLHRLGRAAEIVPRFGPVVGAATAAGVQAMLERDTLCPPTSSAGRWFDAAAAALGLCLHQSEEAQAARALEQAAARAVAAGVPWPALPAPAVGADGVIDPLPTVGALFEARDRDGAAAGFHAALADALAQVALAAARARGVRAVALGGGCFYNRLLRARIGARLRDAGLHVLAAGPHGPGDAGLALGQAWVAALHVAGGCEPSARLAACG